MFDAIAGSYDFLNHFLSAGLDRRWRARAVRELRLGSRARIVDLCTGTADLAMATVRPPRQPHRRSRFRRCHAAPRPREDPGRRLDRAITLVRGDATAIPVRDGWADAATIAFGIRNVQQPRGGARRARPSAATRRATRHSRVRRAARAWYSRRSTTGISARYCRVSGGSSRSIRAPIRTCRRRSAPFHPLRSSPPRFLHMVFSRFEPSL